MEESEKRRERLNAMRMEAAMAGDSGDGFMPSNGLFNPLVEPVAEDVRPPPRAPRFDYYTDPMSAFSSGRRRNQPNHRIPQQFCTPPPGPRNPEMTSSPSYRGPPNYSTDQIMQQTQGPYCSPGAYGSPIRMNSPFYTPKRSGFWNARGGSSNMGNFSSPRFVQEGSPSPSYAQGSESHQSYSPSPFSGRGGTPTHYRGRGRGRPMDNSLDHHSGRSFGRHANSKDHLSAEFRPENYYKKSMIENPWKFLEPVVWKESSPSKVMETACSSIHLSSSLRAKKARIIEASNESSSQPSLAEYLAASFKEAVNNETDDGELHK